MSLSIAARAGDDVLFNAQGELGHSIRIISKKLYVSEIWEALWQDGIKLPYDQFRVYVSRIRRRIAGKPEVTLSRAMPAPEIACGAGEPSSGQGPLIAAVLPIYHLLDKSHIDLVTVGLFSNAIHQQS